MELLGTTRHFQRPRRVPEMPLDLALDRASGERRERHAERGIEPIDRFDEREHRHLLDVVVASGTRVEALRDVDGEAHVLFDDLVAEPAATSARESLEQLRRVRSRHRSQPA